MANVTKEAIKAGQAIYSKFFLSFYDFLILGINCRFIWKCPSHFILENYNRNISANHLDAGVGTGYMLDYCKFPTKTPRLALLDLNQNCLEVTGKRVERYLRIPLNSGGHSFSFQASVPIQFGHPPTG